MKKNYGISETGQAMRTQVAVIKNYCLETGNRVSQMMVTEKWGFTRLSAIIYILKDVLASEGGKYRVCDEIVSCTNRFGHTVHYKEYWLEEVV